MAQVKKGLLSFLKISFFLLQIAYLPICFFTEYNKAIKNYTKFDDWYLWVQMYKGTVSMPVFQSLEAYWPGLQVRASGDSLHLSGAGLEEKSYKYDPHLCRFKTLVISGEICNSLSL